MREDGKMYRVLVVDDEPIAVESVIYMINRNFESVQIVGSSRSGKDAIEKTLNLYPDIIIMDINMPGINGLEAMKQIRKVNPAVRFIVISAFDYFDYAVESVALGVVDYLLKPVKEAKFVETLGKVMELIHKSRMDLKKNLEQQERLEMIIPMLETGFMNSLCLYGEDSKELQHYCDLFGYEKSSGYVMAIEFGQKQHGRIENKIGAGIQGQKMYGEYKKIINSFCNCIVGPVMLNRIIIYVFDASEEENFEQKTRALSLADNIMSRAAGIYPDIFIGIGRNHSNIVDAKKSYQEALFALRIVTKSEEEIESQKNHILHVDDIIEKDSSQTNDYEQLIENEIYANITEKNEKLVQVAFEQLFVRINADKNMEFTTIKNLMIGMVVEFDKRWGNVLSDYYDTLNEIIRASEDKVLYQIGKRFLNDAVSKITSGRQNKVNSIIKNADQYIYDHYAEEITLEDIAKEVNLSSYYFSRFYKEETGINFSDKLSGVRIEKAKELLKREDLSIKDVCYMVGYMEPNYFSKIFKKVTGVTASDYKKLIGL
ncbi:MAG: response regulator [Lachnospiraceae bacterium]|jgi:two-component system response regulator YesN|nr:response regulator [Lachnospiraceae bacterium]